MPAVLALLLGATVSCSSPQDNVPDPPEPTVSPTAVASAIPTAEPSASAKPADNVKTMFVNDKLVDCEGGAGPQKCMQVRDKADGDWEFFYDNIEGFKYEKGHSYELRVEVRKRDNAPADASSLQYVLVEIVSDKPGQ